MSAIIDQKKKVKYMNTVAKILLSAAELVIDPRQVTIYIGYGSRILNSELYNDEREPVWEKHSTAEPWVAIEVAADSALPQCGRNATWSEREDREGRYGSLLRAAQRAFDKCLDKTAGLIKPWPAPGVSIAPWGM